MKAIVQTGYGSSDVLSLKETAKPEAIENQVLIRVKASSVNSGDAFTMKGSPWMIKLMMGLKPDNHILGWDTAGVVEEVGPDATKFKPGDEVYGGCQAAFAEFVTASEKSIALKPDILSFEEAASLPTAAVTALQELRDVGKLTSGKKVLINGASGGVGIFAVQIAKAWGNEVAAVCSGRNADMVKSLGADHVVDYTKEDFCDGSRKYDLILDNIASRSFSDMRRILTPGGIVVPNSGHGGMSYVIKSYLYSALFRNVESMHLTTTTTADLEELNHMIADGKLRTVIDRTYPFEQIPEAVGYVAEGHARGKVVISME